MSWPAGTTSCAEAGSTGSARCAGDPGQVLLEQHRLAGSHRPCGECRAERHRECPGAGLGVSRHPAVRREHRLARPPLDADQASDRSTAGCAKQVSPQSMTPVGAPDGSTSRCRGCRSPCTRTGGDVGAPSGTSTTDSTSAFRLQPRKARRSSQSCTRGARCTGAPRALGSIGSPTSTCSACSARRKAPAASAAATRSHGTSASSDPGMSGPPQNGQGSRRPVKPRCVGVGHRQRQPCDERQHRQLPPPEASTAISRRGKRNSTSPTSSTLVVPPRRDRLDRGAAERRELRAHEPSGACHVDRLRRLPGQAHRRRTMIHRRIGRLTRGSRRCGGGVLLWITEGAARPGAALNPGRASA